MAAILLNGLVKDYNPPGGIDAATTLTFDPTAQPWSAGAQFACPEGWAPNADIANVRAFNIPPDTAAPGEGTYKGTWLSGAQGYTRYDQLDDPVDGFRYICVVTSPNTANRPALQAAQWFRANRQGFAVRSRDAGFYGSVQRTGDATRWFSTEMKALANSGGAQPAFTDKVIDGGLCWNTLAAAAAFKGNWTPAMTVVTGDVAVADGSFMQAVLGGTGDGGTPTWAASIPNYNSGTVADGGIFWTRKAKDAGTWTATTQYGARVYNGNTSVGFDGVRHSGGGILMWGGCTGTLGTTGGSEPSWATASSTLKFWADNNIIWRFGTFAVSGDGIAQNERLVLTGLATPVADGKLITIMNGAAGGTARDVVLADRNCLSTDGIAALTGTDMVSAKPFEIGGLSLRLGEGAGAIFQYSTGTGLWTFQSLVAAATNSIRVVRRRRS